MKKHILLFTLMLMLSSIKTLNAQISVSSYSIYALGIQAPIGGQFAFECKIFANRNDDLYETQIEPTLFYRFKEHPYHRFAAGVGFNFNLYRDLFYVSLPVQLEIFPLQDFKKLSFIIELSPGFEESEPLLRHLWGIRYRFGAN